jgi:hypothetical protein
MEKLKKLQIKVIDEDDESLISQTNNNSKSGAATISETSDFWLNTDVVPNNEETLPETSLIDVYTMCEHIEKIKKKIFKNGLYEGLVFCIWFLFLCIDIYYMIKCKDLRNHSISTLGIFGTCIIIFLVCKYGFLTCLILFLWYRLHKMIALLNMVKHLVIDLQGKKYFDDTQQMGLAIRYLMSIQQVIKNKLKQSREVGSFNIESSCDVNLENINILHQSFFPFLNSSHKGLSAQNAQNSYIRFFSTLDVIPLLTLIIYGFMFIGTQHTQLTPICGQFFTFLCILLVVLIIFSVFIFIMYLINVFR